MGVIADKYMLDRNGVTMSGETEADVSGWTVDTLHSLLQRLHGESQIQTELRVNRLDQEIASIRSAAIASDVASEKAVNAAFIAADKAVSAALLAADKAVSAALLAADRAVQKSEQATEKRFESVNEFRAALTDQGTRLIPRTEAEARFQGYAEKITAIETTMGRHIFREEHDALARSLARLELDVKANTGLTVRREDLIPINTAIERLRDTTTLSSGKSLAFSNIVTIGIALLAIMVSLGLSLYNSSARDTASDKEIVAELRHNRDILRQNGLTAQPPSSAR